VAGREVFLMSGFTLATSFALIAALGGPMFGIGPGRGKPPQPFDDGVVLPGKIPATVKSVSGSWQFGYMLDDAALEGGPADLSVNTFLMLHEDGTYQLNYNARWNLPRAPLPGTRPISDVVNGMKGRVVNESGHFSLSGEVLLLQPDVVEYGVLEGHTVVNLQKIANESHTLIVRLNKAKLAVAGRCASYQVDPVCTETPIIWYPMKAQIGLRWLGREPK
jgi:hypothetical protein